MTPMTEDEAERETQNEPVRHLRPHPPMPDMRTWQRPLDQPLPRPPNSALQNDPGPSVSSPPPEMPPGARNNTHMFEVAAAQIAANNAQGIADGFTRAALFNLGQDQPTPPGPMPVGRLFPQGQGYNNTPLALRVEASMAAQAGSLAPSKAALDSVSARAEAGSLVPDQSLAPVRVEERNGKIALVSDRDSPIRAAEADFNAWRKPIKEPPPPPLPEPRTLEELRVALLAQMEEFGLSPFDLTEPIGSKNSGVANRRRAGTEH